MIFLRFSFDSMCTKNNWYYFVPKHLNFTQFKLYSTTCQSKTSHPPLILEREKTLFVSPQKWVCFVHCLWMSTFCRQHFSDRIRQSWLSAEIAVELSLSFPRISCRCRNWNKQIGFISLFCSKVYIFKCEKGLKYQLN